MNTTKKMATILAVLTICATQAFGDDARLGRRRGGHQGPPPEAYSACEGKSEGDTAEFESPRGDTVTGTCEMEGDRLVLRPDNPPDNRGRGRDDNN